MGAQEERVRGMEQPDKREAQLAQRLERLRAMEEEILQREKAQKSRDGAKKQILLRLAPSLWNEIADWAEADFRSINGQIEYLLTESVRRRHASKE